MEKGENMRANIYDDVIENFDAKNSEKQSATHSSK